jgi:sterol desaturase/sphingolipid hydroxylase (fatty acid hydroxylase superfamily)
VLADSSNPIENYQFMIQYITETTRVVILFWVLLALCSLELVVPYVKSTRTSILQTAPNIVLTVLLILTNFVLAGAFTFSGSLVEHFRIGLLQNIGSISDWSIFLIGIILLDFLGAYLPHFLMHKLAFIWRFHAVHHSDTMVDVTTAFRQHPVETIFRILFQIAAILIVGVSLEVLVLYQTLSALMAQLEHANIRLPNRVEYMLGLIFVTPKMHKLHHSCRQTETDSNYSNILSIWDRLLGTYSARVDGTPIVYGLDYIKIQNLTVRDLLVRVPQKRAQRLK